MNLLIMNKVLDLKNIFKQEIKMYLYSIFDDEIREIKKDF